MKPSRIPNKKTSRVQKPDENCQIDPRRHWPSHNSWDGSVDHFNFKGASSPGAGEEGETSWHRKWHFRTWNLSSTHQDFTDIMQNRDVPGSLLNWGINYASMRPSGRRLKSANDLTRGHVASETEASRKDRFIR